MRENFVPSWKIISKRPCHCYLQGLTTVGFSSNSRLVALSTRSANSRPIKLPLNRGLPIAGRLRSPLQKVFLSGLQAPHLHMHRSILIADLQDAPLGGPTNGRSASSNSTEVYQWHICKLQLYGDLPMADLQAPIIQGSTNGRSASFNPAGALPMADLQAAPRGGPQMAEL
jgi:hypothetical protein